MIAFRERSLPEPGIPTGYAALIGRYELKLPLPPRLSAIAGRHHPRSTPAWQLLTPRHQPDPSLAGQLVFALKWEGVDLAVLAAVFRSVPAGDVAAIVRATPTGGFARRIWFLYEWLTGRELDVEAPGKVRMVPVVDPGLQVTIERATPSSRHRVANNLPGTPRFCPMVPPVAHSPSPGGDRLQPTRPRLPGQRRDPPSARRLPERPRVVLGAAAVVRRLAGNRRGQC